jgi:mono/diheme cytochrome c family protein
MTKRNSAALVAAVVAVAIGVALAAYLLAPDTSVTAPKLETLSASVDTGRYLVTVGNCATCHTRKEGTPYAGGVRFQTPFGVLYSTNITTDKDTGIGRWSFSEFYGAMKRGMRPDGTHLYPAFPYTSFAKLRDADIASIYVFMKTVAPAPSPPRANELGFPFNIRATLGIWNKLFHNPEKYTDDSRQSAEWNRGAYLVQGLGHCGACHTPRNILGAERSDARLKGGTFVDEVVPGKYRHWSAVDLTSDATGLAGWSAENIAMYLKTGESDHAIVHGPMNEVVMNSTRHLTDADAHAIATYLKSLPANARNVGAAGTFTSAKPPDAGEVAYTVHCGTCHLPSGLGDEVLGVTLAGNPIVQAPDPSSMINVILYGPHLPPPPFVVDRTRMKPFGKRLSDDDIASLATYVRRSFGNHASAVTAEVVNRQR